MNLYEECSIKQINLLNRAGVNIENKEYASDEIKYISNKVVNYIISQSKNNIWKVREEYDEILRKIV